MDLMGCLAAFPLISEDSVVGMIGNVAAVSILLSFVTIAFFSENCFSKR